MISTLYRLADRLRHRARLRTLPVGAVHGHLGEDLAHRFLRRSGFTVVARNYRLPSGGGEIDLIGWDGETLVFVEVKTRAGEEFGAPEAAIDDNKRIYLERAARDYAHRAGVGWERVRFDVVNVILSAPPKIELRKDAFRRARTL
jgi:putative endonuclease